MNSFHEPQFAWFLWSLFLALIWGVVYLFLRNKEGKKEMLLVSLWTSILGLTEPLFVPKYWSPPSLFDLAHKTGFDIESLIFSFNIGGLAVAVYDHIFRVSHKQIKSSERNLSYHRYHLFSVLSAPVVFFFLLVIAPLNPIYSAVIAMLIGGIFSLYCRPDLKKKMIASAFIFLGIYFVYFLTLIAVYPGYVEQVWNFKNISGILISGVPLEELLFAFSFGFIWSSVYEHFAWRKIKSVLV